MKANRAATWNHAHAKRSMPRVQILGSENPDRHAPGKERPPRPIGVRPGLPWQPIEPERSYAGANLTAGFLEKLEFAPWLQDIAVAAFDLIAPLINGPKTPLPPDIAPEPGSWKFVAIGDYGAGTPPLRRVMSNVAKSGAELIITAGDNVYPTGRWVDFRNNWEPSVGPVARKIPFMPALGNHDMYRDDLRPFFGHFPHLQGLTYYTYTHENAQFFALDSDQDLRVGSAQYRWLERELAKCGSEWKVVYLHYPMFGSGLEEFKSIREAVQPLLEKYGVQLVVAGHEHNYLRAKPQGGVLHMLTGGGGQRVYPFLKKQPDWIARRLAAYHHLEISVGVKSLVIRAIDEYGKRIDSVQVLASASDQAKAGAAQLAPGGRHVTAKAWPGMTTAHHRAAQAEIANGIASEHVEEEAGES